MIANESRPLGVGWTHSYLARIAVVPVDGGTAADKVKVYRPDGAVQTFTLVGGVWTSDADVSERLSVALSGNYLLSATYTTDDDSVETYDQLGRLSSITNRDGLVQTLQYFTGAAGSEVSHNFLQRVIDPNGRTLAFTYTGDLLTGVVLPTGQTITFGYAGDNLAAP